MDVDVKIKKMKFDFDGTTLIILAVNQNLVDYILQHNVSTGMLQLPDGRMIYPEQRKKAYAMEKDIAKLADILGHSSIDTTRIYIMTTAQEHRRQIERLGLVV